MQVSAEFRAKSYRYPEGTRSFCKQIAVRCRCRAHTLCAPCSDDHEFCQLLNRDGISDDIHLFNAKLREWEDYYSYYRPHGAVRRANPVRAAAGKDESWLSPA